MLEIFKTIDGELVSLDNIEDGVWINMTKPNKSEINKICTTLNLDSDYILAALDEEERSRIESDEEATLIIVDIPITVKTTMKDTVSDVYETIPLGIVLTNSCIITVCLQENPVIRDFIDKKIKTFWTFKKTRFILQILYKNSTKYLQYLKKIDKLSNTIEAELHKSMKNKELIQLLELEKSLVYFSTSLKANEIVLEKMMRTESIKNYPEDEELLEDVIIENKQAIEMAKIYSDILSGTMDAFASVISNNLNIVMKFLASITIVLAIPTMVASFFGMNVIVPLTDNPMAFPIIVGSAFGLSAIAALVMIKKKMF